MLEISYKFNNLQLKWPRNTVTFMFFATSAFSSVKEMAKLNTRGKSIVFSNFGFEPLNTWNYGNRPILGKVFLDGSISMKNTESSLNLRVNLLVQAWKWCRCRVWSHDFGFPYPWIHAMHFGEAPADTLGPQNIGNVVIFLMLSLSLSS